MPSDFATRGELCVIVCPFSLTLAAVSVDRAGDDLDKGGFARAVLAYQRMHFARAQLKRGALQRLHAGVRFGDVDGAEQDMLSVIRRHLQAR